MSLRIATFNVENLMARFDFSGWRDDQRRDRAIAGRPVKSESEYKALERARVVAHEDDARQMSALAIAQCAADIVCLQEVENLETLETFERSYLNRMTGITYPHKVWKQGNDGRGIDVAIMARESTRDGRLIEVLNTKSHRKTTFGDYGLLTKDLQTMGYEAKDRIFRRDCLEVDLSIGGRRLTLFNTHFKSMGPSRNGEDGRSYTMPVRLAEARAVKRIIQDKFGSERVAKMRWLLCGDLNDYTERLMVSGDQAKGYGFAHQREGSSGIAPLLEDGFSDNLVERLPQDARWTLYHAAGPVKNLDLPETRETRHLVQLDYLLASPALAAGNPSALPMIYRQGQPYRTVFPPGQTVPRYPRTGWDRPKASDHCPVAVTLEMV
ncbi:MAG: endonuclease [Pseudomonadota bacterium]